MTTTPFPRSSSSTAIINSPNPVVIPVPSGVVARDIIVAALFVYQPSGTITITPPDTSWASLQGSPLELTDTLWCVFWKRATASDSGNYSFVVDGTYAFSTGQATSYVGCSTSGNPFDAIDTAVDQSAANMPIPAVELTTTRPNELLLWIYCNNAQVGVNVPIGFHTDVEPFVSLITASKAQDSPGDTGPITGSTVAAIQHAVYLLALLPAVSVAISVKPPAIVRNLLPGQYQIGDLVFGRATTVPVENFDIKPYDVNAQDYQVSRADEMRFGWDQLKPTTIEITFDILNNKLLPPYEDYIPNFWTDMPTVAQFQKEWKGDDIRYVWGQMKPLYVCGRDGITRTVYGRPGQFTYAKNSQYSEVLQCIAEFRRADTLSYSVNETGILMTPSSPTVSVEGTLGDAYSWLRIELEGPIVSPVFTLTGLCVNGVTIETPIEIQLDYTVADGEVVEINAYPWTRRCISSTGLNLSAQLIGQTPYLDRLRFEPDATLEVTMSGTGTGSNTVAALLFRDAYQVVG
jgi:hypothetical protein